MWLPPGAAACARSPAVPCSISTRRSGSCCTKGATECSWRSAASCVGGAVSGNAWTPSSGSTSLARLGPFGLGWTRQWLGTSSRGTAQPWRRLIDVFAEPPPGGARREIGRRSIDFGARRRHLPGSCARASASGCCRPRSQSALPVVRALALLGGGTQARRTTASSRASAPSCASSPLGARNSPRPDSCLERRRCCLYSNGVAGLGEWTIRHPTRSSGLGPVRERCTGASDAGELTIPPSKPVAIL